MVLRADHLFFPSNLHKEACVRCGMPENQHVRPINLQLNIDPRKYLCECGQPPREVAVRYHFDAENHKMYFYKLFIECWNFHHFQRDVPTT